MATFDAGVFLILASLAFGSLVVSFKLGSAFRVLGSVIFFALSIIMMANYDIAYHTTTLDGSTTINETKYIIGDGNASTNEQTNWLGWIFLALGIYTSVLFITDMLKLVKPNTEID